MTDMLRIIRTSILHALQSDAVKAAEIEKVAATQAEEIASLSSSRDEYKKGFDNAMRQLGQAHADKIQAERDCIAARTERDEYRADVDRQLAELRIEYRRLHDAAADPEIGSNVRAAIAFGVLRSIYVEGRAKGMDTSPLDMTAFVCGFDVPDARADAAAIA